MNSKKMNIKLIKGIRVVTMISVFGMTQAPLAVQADDNRKKVKDCAQNGVLQSKTWMWAGKVGAEYFVSVAAEATGSETSNAVCEEFYKQINTQAQGTGEYELKLSSKPGDDACAFAPLRKPENSPSIVTDILKPCGLMAAEQAEKPSE